MSCAHSRSCSPRSSSSGRTDQRNLGFAKPRAPFGTARSAEGCSWLSPLSRRLPNLRRGREPRRIARPEEKLLRRADWQGAPRSAQGRKAMDRKVAFDAQPQQLFRQCPDERAEDIGLVIDEENAAILSGHGPQP